MSTVDSGLGGWLLSRTPDVIHPSTPQETCQGRSGCNPVFTNQLIPNRGLRRKEGSTQRCFPHRGQGSPPLWAGRVSSALRAINRKGEQVNLGKKMKMEGPSHLETFSRISPTLLHSRAPRVYNTALYT